MVATFLTFLMILTVLCGSAVLARKLAIAPAIVFLIVGIALAFTPGFPRIEIKPEGVLLLVLPPLIYSAGVSMSWREFKSNLRPITLLAIGCVIFTTCAVAAGGAARHRQAAETAASHSGDPRRRRPRQRRHRADPLSLRGAGRIQRHVLACTCRGHIRCDYRRRSHLRHCRRMAQPVAAPSRARSAGGNRPVAADTVSRLLGAGTSRRIGRDRHRRDRPLHELERPAADSREHPPARDLFLGHGDLADRGRAVPDDRL